MTDVFWAGLFFFASRFIILLLGVQIFLLDETRSWKNRLDERHFGRAWQGQEKFASEI